jgi:hypothetical protein
MYVLLFGTTKQQETLSDAIASLLLGFAAIIPSTVAVIAVTVVEYVAVIATSIGFPVVLV